MRVKRKWIGKGHKCKQCGHPIGFQTATYLCRECRDVNQAGDLIQPEDCREECRDRVEDYRRQLEENEIIDYSNPLPLVNSAEWRGRTAGRHAGRNDMRGQRSAEDHRNLKRRHKLTQLGNGHHPDQDY